MKRLILAFLLLLIPLSPVGWTGMSCKPSQQRITYNTLSSVGQAVNAAYAAYNDQVIAGKATFSTQVAQKYNEFQAALSVAVNAAQNVTTAPAPQNITDLANAVYGLIKQFTH